ncbi:MAG TPA: hypothetical protein PLE25_04285 [Spirochaetales bacterium]|nr:hypothetical protein [Spirochaetales bacterium]
MRRPAAAARAERREHWEGAFDPTRLALTGVLLSIVLLFQPTLYGRVAMLAAAAAAAWASGRRLSPLMTVFVMAGIVAANLLVPMGRRLATFGPLVVTETALLTGVEKAVTFEALMFISKACLGPALRLPGRFGSFFADALRGYDRILEHKGSVKLDGFMRRIDEILISVYDGFQSGGDRVDTGYRGRPAAFRRGDPALAVIALAAVVSLLIR